MKLYGRLLEYLIYTAIVTFVYYPVIIPWLFYVGHVPIERIEQYLWQGYIIDLAIAYPAGKLLVKLSPKIQSICGIDLGNIRNTFNKRLEECWNNLTNI